MNGLGIQSIHLLMFTVCIENFVQLSHDSNDSTGILRIRNNETINECCFLVWNYPTQTAIINQML